MLPFFQIKVSVSVSLSATDLNGALLKAVMMLKKERKQGKLPERSSDMIILLTDGMPNHGERVCPMKLFYTHRSA